jgi:type II secretory pathway predicted ATPase ExeA
MVDSNDVVGIPEANLSENTPHSEQVSDQYSQPKSVKEWITEKGWSESPFTFSIAPELYVGYEGQKKRLLSAIEEKHNISMVLGPTGSGKTSLLKWATTNVPENFDIIYVGKPPSNTEELIDIFNNKYGPPWFLRFFISNIKNPYQIPDVMNNKLKNKHLVLFFDEAHEANVDMLEWIRVLSDQIDNMTIIIAGLPIFESKVKENLETLRKRIMTKIEVLSLTKEEMQEMIKRRIESVGGSGFDPFQLDSMDSIYQKTGGFPREVLRVCSDLISDAASQGKDIVTTSMVSEERREDEPGISTQAVDALTPMQREVIDILASGPNSPGQIANQMQLDKYKTRQHAVRSVNNILIRMMQDHMVERTRKDRTFVYRLAAKLKTVVVNK